jgi:hypothetical protein
MGHTGRTLGSSSWGVFSRRGSVTESDIVVSIRFSLDFSVSAIKGLLFIAFEAIQVDRMNHACYAMRFRRMSVHFTTENISFGPTCKECSTKPASNKNPRN